MNTLYNYNRENLIESDITMKVHRHILSIASPDEAKSIDLRKVFPTSGFRVIADIYIGKGIKQFGWRGRTVIEIKAYIDSRVLTQTYKAFQKINDEIDTFILIYHKTNFSSNPTFDKISNKFKVIEYDEFIYWHQQTGVDENHNSIDKNEFKSSTDTDFALSNEHIDWKKKRSDLLESLRQDIAADKVSLFLGAGVSASANMPGWEKLLQTLLTKHCNDNSPQYLDCDFANVLKSCGDSYLIAARYINSIIDKSKRAEIIQQALYANKRPSTLIDSICKLIKENGINQIITTNYDQLIEQRLKELKLKPHSVTHHGIIPKDVDVVVYHVHGSVNDPKNPIVDGVPDAPVLSEEDYHALYATGHHWSNTAILHAFQHSHCIFIGLSMTDPNLRRLLEYAYNKTEETPHYVFLCRRPLYQGYYESDKRNQNHFKVQEDLMASLGIRVIWYELDSNSSTPHHKLEDIIQELNHRK